MAKVKGDVKLNRVTGALIREMRKRGGMSQTALGKKMGVSFQQVQKYENGTTRLSIPRVFQVAKVFNMKPSDLVGEIEKRSRP